LTNEQRSALRSYAEALPAGAVLPVPREWLMSLLDALLQTSTAAEPRLLTPEDIAQRLQVDIQWVYRRAKKWPFTRRLGRLLRFASVGLERWLARQAPDRPDPSR
jgi:hypothetical protein